MFEINNGDGKVLFLDPYTNHRVYLFPRTYETLCGAKVYVHSEDKMLAEILLLF